MPPHYLLRLKLSDSVSQDIRSLYESAVVKHNDSCNSEFFDAGFDLFCPSDLDVLAKTTVKINQEVKGEMRFITSLDDCRDVGLGVGYYMYPRSSTGTKTPLRLANSVGIIDSGYRGEIIVKFHCNTNLYSYSVGDRVAQLIIMPYPQVEFEEVKELSDTERGQGGFGSTGS